MNHPPRLHSELDPQDFRGRFGELLSRAHTVEVATTRVRLSLVDFGPTEVAGLDVMRVLLAEVNALRLAAEAESALGDPGRTRSLSLLLDLLGEGRIQVRSAPMGGWAPDFSVFSNADGPFAALVGVHSFMRSTALPGPLFFSEHGATAARGASRRFATLWASAHDVGTMLAPMLREAASAGV